MRSEGRTMTKEKGPLFTVEDIKGNIVMNLQSTKKMLSQNKTFYKNCNKAQTLVRQAKTLDGLLRIIEHYDMSRYLTNGTKHMLGVLKANQACPHLDVDVQHNDDGSIEQVVCGVCEIPLKFKTSKYVPKEPEGEIVGEFTLGKRE